MSSPGDQLWSSMTTMSVAHFTKQNLDDGSNKKWGTLSCTLQMHPPGDTWIRCTPSLPTHPFGSLSLFESQEEQMALTVRPGGQQRVLSFWCKTLYFLSDYVNYPSVHGCISQGDLAQGSPWRGLARGWRRYKTSSKVNSKVLIAFLEQVTFTCAPSCFNYVLNLNLM